MESLFRRLPGGGIRRAGGAASDVAPQVLSHRRLLGRTRRKVPMDLSGRFDDRTRCKGDQKSAANTIVQFQEAVLKICLGKDTARQEIVVLSKRLLPTSGVCLTRWKLIPNNHIAIGGFGTKQGGACCCDVSEQAPPLPVTGYWRPLV